MIKVLNFDKTSTRPVFKTLKGGKWINYGKKNAYPEYLLDVFHNRSNKHKAIISKKVDMTTSNGFTEPISSELKEFYKNKHSDDDLEEIATRINYDLEIMNGFALIVKWSIDGKKIAALEWLPFHKCRLSLDEESIFVSSDWKNYRRAEHKPEEFLRFDSKQTKEFKTQVFYYTVKTNGVDYYPLPYYSSTLDWIELDGEIANFHLSGVRNGFTPSFMLNIATGIPEEEQMNTAVKALENKFSGTSNANKVLVTFSEGKENESRLTPIQLNDSDERFILLHKEMQNEIFIGHSVTSPMLFGIRTPGSLGGGTELLESLAIFQSTYIKGKQNTITKQLGKLAAFNGITEEMILNEYEINFSLIQK